MITDYMGGHDITEVTLWVITKRVVMTTMMMWMMLSDLSLRASSLHRGSGRFSPALALAVRAMYNVYNKQQTQNTSYLTDVLMWVRRNAI